MFFETPLFEYLTLNYYFCWLALIRFIVDIIEHNLEKNSAQHSKLFAFLVLMEQFFSQIHLIFFSICNNYIYMNSFDNLYIQ